MRLIFWLWEGVVLLGKWVVGATVYEAADTLAAMRARRKHRCICYMNGRRGIRVICPKHPGR